MAYETGCQYNKPSTSYNAYFTSNYEEASLEPEVCTHKMAIITKGTSKAYDNIYNFDPKVVKECKALSSSTLCSANAKCYWMTRCIMSEGKMYEGLNNCGKFKLESECEVYCKWRGPGWKKKSRNAYHCS